MNASGHLQDSEKTLESREEWKGIQRGDECKRELWNGIITVVVVVPRGHPRPGAYVMKRVWVRVTGAHVQLWRRRRSTMSRVAPHGRSTDPQGERRDILDLVCYSFVRIDFIS